MFGIGTQDFIIIAVVVMVIWVLIANMKRLRVNRGCTLN
jgi:hypothetical protein